MHVDDVVVCATAPRRASLADGGLARCVDCVVERGLEIPDRKFDGEVDKVTGHSPQRHPDRFALSQNLSAQFSKILCHLALSCWAHVKTLHTKVLFWVLAASFNRQFLSVHHAVFRFSEGERGSWLGALVARHSRGSGRYASHGPDALLQRVGPCYRCLARRSRRELTITTAGAMAS